MGEPSTIGVQTEYGERMVDCVFIKGGLAVHEWPRGILDSWTITHIASGYSVCKGIADRDTAIAATRELLTVVDWDLESDELVANRKAIREAVRPIFARHGILFASDHDRIEVDE